MKWHLNITVKMLGYLLAASMVPLVLLGLTAFQISKRVVIEQAEDESTRLLGSFAAYLKLYNDQVDDMAANIAGNEAIGETLRLADAHNLSSIDDLKMRAQMGRILNSYVRVKGLVSIDIFSQNGQHFHVGETLNVTKVNPTLTQGLLNESLAAPTPNLWRGVDNNLNTGSQQKKVISVVRAIQHFSTETGKSDTVGLLLINLNDEIMHSFLQGVPLGAGTQLMQLDHRGNITLHSEDRQFGQPLNAAVLDLVHANPPVKQFTLNAEDVLLSVTPADAQQHWLAVITPRKVLTAKVNQLALATFVLVLTGLLAILAITWRFAQTVVAPIRSVSNGFRRLAKYPQGQHEPLDPGPAQDEIGQLVEGYNDHLASLQAQRTAAQDLLRSEAERRETETMLTTAIEAIDEAFAVYDTQDRLLFCNDKYMAIYTNGRKVIAPGRTYAEIVRGIAKGTQYDENPEQFERWVAARVDQHQKGQMEVELELGNGRWTRVVERKTAMGHIVGFRVDITELKHAQQAAVAASEAKSGFLATMSHEIRTPMNGILGMLTLLEHTPLNERQLDYTRKAQGATKALLGIINDILDFSKVESGKMDLDHSNFALDTVLRDLDVVVSAGLNAKPVNLRFDVDADAPAFLVGDPLRLRQILINLAGNAIKFTEQGEVTVRVRRVNSTPSTVQLEFSVQDSGIGIAQDKLAYIFEGFSQAESSTTRRFGGTGLGLAISKRLVNLMGGDLQVHSELGRGSRFFFTLNFDIGVASPTANAPPSQPGQKSQRLAGLRLLVVEDNLLNQQVAFELLTRSGAQVELAGGGLDGVAQALAADPPFDAVLMDLQMPDIDGLEATRRIRSHTRMLSVPVIAMTANAMHSDKEACLAAGMVDHVSKPIDLNHLIDTLLNHTGRAPSHFDLAPTAELAATQSHLDLDVDAAIARMDGDPDFYAQIARMFQTDAPTQMANMRQHLRQNQWIEATRCAHTLKGLAATLGATALATDCATLESALKQNSNDTLPLLDGLQVQLARALAQLDTVLSAFERNAVQAAPANAPTPLDLPAIIPALQALADRLRKNDMHSTTLCTQIGEQYGAALGQPYALLNGAVQRLDFEAALAHCNAWLSTLAEHEESR